MQITKKKKFFRLITLGIMCLDKSLPLNISLLSGTKSAGKISPETKMKVATLKRSMTQNISRRLGSFQKQYTKHPNDVCWKWKCSEWNLSLKRDERKIGSFSIANTKLTIRQVRSGCCLNSEVSFDTLHRVLQKNNLNEWIAAKKLTLNKKHRNKN